MKIRHSLTLLTLGLTSMSLTGMAQISPSQSTLSSDTTRPAKSAREQRRSIRSNRSAENSMNENAKNGTSPATPQEGQYRQSSSAAGTSINNSNSTNYNSNNVTNAPTGVGSNPSVIKNPTTLSGSSSSGGNTIPSGSTSNESNATGEAVSGASTTKTPAEVAGSTERTTNIHDFVASSPNYTTLQNALQSADLYNMINQNDTYTLFAPSNAAFKKLPAAVQGGLLEGRNRDALKQLLSYHLVKGSLDAASLKEQIKSGNGKAQLQTLGGGTLTVQTGTNGRITITDEQGKKASVDDTVKLQTNAIVYGIDAVLMPKNSTIR